MRTTMRASTRRRFLVFFVVLRFVQFVYHEGHEEREETQSL